MNCYLHPDREAVGACTSCGRLICQEDAVEMQGRLVCRECLSTGRVAQSAQNQGGKDPSTAFIIELVGGFFGLLGLGYFYTGRTSDGVIRLIAWIIYDLVAFVIISLLLAVFVGILCIPFQLAIQIGIPIWSASSLKKQLLAQQAPVVTPITRQPMITGPVASPAVSSQPPSQPVASDTDAPAEDIN